MWRHQGTLRDITTQTTQSVCGKLKQRRAGKSTSPFLMFGLIKLTLPTLSRFLRYFTDMCMWKSLEGTRQHILGCLWNWPQLLSVHPCQGLLNFKLTSDLSCGKRMSVRPIKAVLSSALRCVWYFSELLSIPKTSTEMSRHPLPRPSKTFQPFAVVLNNIFMLISFQLKTSDDYCFAWRCCQFCYIYKVYMSFQDFDNTF